MLACQVQPDPNGSQLCITLAFENGRIVVDRQNSTFVPSRRIKGDLKERLISDLESRILSRLSVPGCSGSWARCRETFQGFDEVVNFETGGTLLPLKSAHESLPLFLNEKASGRGLLYRPKTGELSFSVMDPVEDYSDPKQIAIGFQQGFDNPQRERNLRRRLAADWNGEILCRDCIQDSVRKFYEDVGLDVETTVLVRRDRPPSLEILEGRRVTEIVMPPVADDARIRQNYEAVLYTLLEEADYRRNAGRWIETLDPGGDGANSASYYFESGRRPYLHPNTLQIQQLVLQQLGFTVAVEPGESEPRVESRVQLLVSKTEDAIPAPRPAPALAGGSGLVDPHTQESEQRTENTSGESDPRDKRNFLGGGFEYRPGQGVRGTGVLQASRLRLPFRNTSLSAQAGGFGSFLGSANYFADYLFFGALHRRVSLTLGSTLETEPGRFLLGRRFDDHRSGGSGRVELEWWRDRHGQMLRSHFEVRHDTVELTGGDMRLPKTNLTTAQFGVLYNVQSVEADFPRRLRLEPCFKAGLGLAAGEPAFQKVEAPVNFHQEMPGRFALDISARVETASGRTPVFELPSLGGAGSVRGFRRDDVLGRGLWSVQNEFWLPVPLGRGEDSLRSFVKSKIRVALYGDVGRPWDTVAPSIPGTRAGAGAGLRIVFWPFVLKLDYAYAVAGAAATGGSRGKFYFSLGSIYPI